MEKLNTKIVVFGLLLTLLVGALVVNSYTTVDEEPQMVLGGVNETYQYQQFTGAIATTTVLKGGSNQTQYPGNFHGVVINEDSATAVVFWDATSSAAVTDGTYATRIADFEAAQAEGMYIYDAGFTRGLVMQSTDGFTFAGDWTVLWN
jgi:hypothetical protein